MSFKRSRVPLAAQFVKEAFRGEITVFVEQLELGILGFHPVLGF